MKTIDKGNLPSLLADVVATRGGEVAVYAGDSATSYAELDAWSNAVARQILDAVGGGPEPVAILGGQDAKVAAAMVATSKAGRPYVIVDTSTPVTRMRQLLTMAMPIATVATSEFTPTSDEIGDVCGTVITIDPTARDTAPIDISQYAADRIATIIFTSGSTGVPKGVMQPESALVSDGMPFGMSGDPTGNHVGIPQPLSFGFGSSALVRALVWGASVCLFDARHSTIDQMVDWVLAREITVLNLTPHAMRSVAAAAIERNVTFSTLRRINVGGEAVLASDVKLMRRCVTEACAIHNVAASSEAGVMTSTRLPIDLDLPDGLPIPAGPPLPDRGIELVDDEGTPITEPGITGMLTITSHRTARGYWGNPELTAERFTVLPDGRRRYRTGDLAQWDLNGALAFVGRSDHMLKIRGYLVEPAEIEAKLRAEGEVRECAVVGQKSNRDGVLQLVAYVVPDPANWVSSAALRRRLATELPPYMVPQILIELAALPRNPNGKLDRQALPPAPQIIPEYDIAEVDKWASVPRIIESIFCAALGLEYVGLDTNVFAAGADSLAVEEILAALEAELHLSIDSATLMAHPTAAELERLPRDAPTDLRDGVLCQLAPAPNPSKTPLFIVCGGAGLAVQFRQLAQRLGDERAVYALQMRGLEGGLRPDFTIAAMARRYTRLIREVQPHGPYNIAGHSLGTHVGYEVTRRLRRFGEEVHLHLFDPLGGTPRTAPEEQAEPAHSVPRTRETAPSRDLTHLRDRLDAIALHRMPQLSRSFWRLFTEDRVAAVWHVGVVAMRKSPTHRGQLRGAVTTIYMAQVRHDYEHEADFQSHLSPPATHVSVEGGHNSMFRPPFIDDLVNQVRGRLI